MGCTLGSGQVAELVLNVVLPGVSKPGRYTDSEFNAFHKSVDARMVRLLLAFPDVYEVGMSHLGLRILYFAANSRTDCAAERAFAPWPDMERAMREHGVPLYGLESFSPAREFDLLGFSLQYEMSYTNLLTMLDLAGIPLRSSDRTDADPLVVGGGPCAFNPEPVADFFDLFVLGDGEDVLGEIIAEIARFKQETRGGLAARDERLRALASIPGVYVPAFYEPVWDGPRYAGTVARVPGAPPVVVKRTKEDLGDESAAFYDRLVVPNIEIVHDRVTLEVFRGCTRGCRFCQAGAIHRPVRERPVALLVDKARRAIRSTGYEEISLMSLNTSDYSGIEELLDSLQREFRDTGVAISLPSLRADPFSVRLALRLGSGTSAGVRKAGITLAPEAGTQRLRDVINKNVSEDDLMSTVDAAVEAGWTSFKLYFMIGLPTETDEDVEGIASLSRRVLERARAAARGRGGTRGGRQPAVHVSVASFVPKPHTPFQWAGQAPVAVLERRQGILARGVTGRGLRFSYHDARVSMMEAVFSRGDRRLSGVVEAAWKAGARFDGWSETFDYGIWQGAFSSCGVDPADFATRWIEPGQPLPWGHLSAGVRPGFLEGEFEKSRAGLTTADCRWERCQGCGACAVMRQADRTG